MYLKEFKALRNNQYNRLSEQTVLETVGSLEDLVKTYDPAAKYYKLIPLELIAIDAKCEVKNDG